MKYGRYTIISTYLDYVGTKGTRATWAKVVCDCGNERNVRVSALKSGKQKSCGCLRNEKSSERCIAKATHGATRGRKKNKTYIVWKGLRARCLSPGQPAYLRYGGRGITVCDRWESYENFLADMGERPVGHSLDRIDNNGPYSPENCKWSTYSDQARNTRRNRLVQWSGKMVPLIVVSEDTGIPYKTLHKSVVYKGLSVQEAVERHGAG